MKISIFHNMLWSKYKGGVFSAIYKLTADTSTKVSFTQIALTEGDRISLGAVDMSYHAYPHELIFPGAYSSVPTFKRIAALVKRAWKSDAEVVVLPGYDRVEYWAMLFTLMLRGTDRAVFCDSTKYDNPQSKLKSAAKRFFFSHCHGFFAYGTRSSEYLQLHGVPKSRIFFRCQAAALPKNYDQASALAARISLGPKVGDAPTFLYVGRLSWEKGLDTLVAAMAKVVAARPNASLRLVGAGSLKGDLQDAAAKAGIAENLKFLGSMNVEQLAVEYAKADALLLPSISEPWGLVVNEALSHGCPAVTSNVCGCVPELIVEGKTGFTFAMGDANDLASKMMLTTQVFKEIGSTARHCIDHMSQFTPDRAAQQIVDGCSSIVSSRRVGARP